MCRNIKTLANFAPPATDDEIRASALQFVRKLSGANKPSRANEVAFNHAVDEVTAAAQRLIHSLTTTAPPRNREEEAQKVRRTFMRKSAVALSLLALAAIGLSAQSYPPPFPRTNATKVLENDRLIAWDVVWPKGQPTAMHQHPYDLVAAFLEPGDRMITSQDGTKRPTTAKAYDVSLTPKGNIHIEEGTSDKPPRAILVELKESSARMLPPVDAPAPTAFPRPGAKQLLDNSRVTIWEYKWTLGAPVPLHKHDRDTLVVWFENGKLQSAPLTGAPSVIDASFGKLRYSERGTVHTETAVEGPPHAVIIELK